MNAVLTVARKELRGLFGSPIALVFLGVFQLFVLFTFFSASRFFARNLADVRPLFEWLPLLLVFLTAAVTMRAWAEEKKLGTLEVLMTLPVDTTHLVLGKFAAAVGLVATALLLTLPLPLMVSTLGPLDLGPVIGGYVGALCLGALYVSLGLCVSARTDNQVVSLMVTLVIGGALYLVGSEAMTSLVADDTARVLRGLGTGARFESIERGVIDLRDLAYYAGLTATFLALNVAFLERDRVDAGSPRGAANARRLWTVTALVAANGVALVAWLTPVTALRADLTANGDYSISEVTEGILAELDEPLFLEGYFSERTHPLLAPLVPQIEDLVAEYVVAGDGRVEATFVDPNTDEDLETELAEQYGIRSVPFQVADRTQQAVVNSFFHLLVRYGDEYEVLSFDDLIEVAPDDQGGVSVRLRNLEYDLTRAIKRVSQDFQTLGTLLAAGEDPLTVTLVATPGSLPEDWSDTLAAAREVGAELGEQASLTFTELDPTTEADRQQALYDQFRITPIRPLFGNQGWYLHLTLERGDQAEALRLSPGLTAADLKTAIESAVQRMTPGQLTTVGFLTDDPEAPPPNPQIPPQFQPPTPQPDYRAVQEALSAQYQVTPLTFEGEDAEIPDTVDVLVVGKTGPLGEAGRTAIDQFLMRGGRVIALAGGREVEVGRRNLTLADADADLLELLKAWGVTVGSDLIEDPQAAVFPRPEQGPGGQMRIRLEPYPLFPDIRADGMAASHPAMAGLPNLTAPWSSPITLEAPDGVEATVLASTSAQSWTYGGTSVEGGPPTGEPQRYDVAVALTGTFPSAVASEDDEGLAKESLPDAKLVVVSSSEIVSDLLVAYMQQLGGESHRGNLQLLQNLIDWSTEDTDLLQIRSAGAFARTLTPLDDASRSRLEATQYGIALVLLIGIALAARRRRELAPLPLSTVEQA